MVTNGNVYKWLGLKEIKLGKKNIMQKITGIDYVIDPLFHFDMDKKSTLSLLDSIIQLSKEQGGKPENLTILRCERLNDHHPDMNQKKFNNFILEYLGQQTRLIGAFIENCRNFYLGSTKDYADFDAIFRDFGGEFNLFLRKNNLEIDAENLQLFGHGTYSDACIPEVLDSFVSCVKRRHGVTVKYKIPEETSMTSF